MNFHAGQRVRCVKGYARVKEGETGTVYGHVEGCPPIGVCWDEYDFYKNDLDASHTGELRCTDGHGYYVYEENITLLENIINIDDFI